MENIFFCRNKKCRNPQYMDYGKQNITYRTALPPPGILRQHPYILPKPGGTITVPVNSLLSYWAILYRTNTKPLPRYSLATIIMAANSPISRHIKAEKSVYLKSQIHTHNCLSMLSHGSHCQIYNLRHVYFLYNPAPHQKFSISFADYWHG